MWRMSLYLAERKRRRGEGVGEWGKKTKACVSNENDCVGDARISVVVEIGCFSCVTAGEGNAGQLASSVAHATGGPVGRHVSGRSLARV